MVRARGRWDGVSLLAGLRSLFWILESLLANIISMDFRAIS